MFRRILLVGITAVGLGVLAPVALAEPSVPQVVQSIQNGHYDQAQQQLSEVLAAHPNSAQAQYLEARLLAKQGKWQEAAAALDKAKSIDPSLSFVHAKALASFEQQLQKHSRQAVPATAAATAQKSHLGSALAWFLGLIAVIAGISWFMRRRRQALAYRQMQVQGFPGSYPGQGNQAYPGPYGAGPTPGAGGVGSGLASGIATGVGIGAGMAAGNALANSLFGNHEGGNNNDQNGTGQDDFGMTDTSWGNDGGDLGLGGDDDSWV